MRCDQGKKFWDFFGSLSIAQAPILSILSYRNHHVGFHHMRRKLIKATTGKFEGLNLHNENDEFYSVRKRNEVTLWPGTEMPKWKFRGTGQCSALT